ncbi:MAG: hypothetical protein WCO18_01430 [bacterium]
MSLGDLGNNLNKQGGNLYNQQKGRIMREAEEQKKRMEAQELDRKMRMETSHKKLEKQTIEGRILQLTREIAGMGRTGSNNSGSRTDLAIKQRQLESLRNDRLRLEGEIRSLETGAHGAAHNLHYNNPTYF